MTALTIDSEDLPTLTYDYMRQLAARAFGAQGIYLCNCWRAYNTTYFGGVLKPVPLILVSASPYGRWAGLTTHSNKKSVFSIQIKRNLDQAEARTVLLHEMIHQALAERGDNAKHAGDPWRREIERLSRDVYGIDVQAKGSRVTKINNGDGTRSSVRLPPEPTDCNVLDDKQIGVWPFDYLPSHNGCIGLYPHAPCYTKLPVDDKQAQRFTP